jgi:predicted GIY-YIG superfamily endonuclease
MSNLLGCTIINEFPNDRKENYFRYYHPIRREFGAEFLVASSNSKEVPTDYHMPITTFPAEAIGIEKFKPNFYGLNILTFEQRLPTRLNIWTYSEYWRSLWANLKLAKALDCVRLIELETDAWVYTKRLANRMINYRNGIGCPYCAKHKCAELMAAVYHRDTYDAVISFIESKSWEEWAKPQPCDFENAMMQKFKIDVWKDFLGDRHLEYGHAMDPNADFSVNDIYQVPVWRG